MPSTAGSVILRAANHLNDSSQLVYTTPVLLPFLNMALDELEGELAVFGLSALKKTTVTIPVPANSPSIPAMPVDFVEPLSLRERISGSTDDWTPITEVSDIDPNMDNVPSIIQWTIRNVTIFINPPQVDREVVLDYVGGLTQASSAGTAIDIEASREYLGLVTARNAASDLGNSPSKAKTFDSRIERAQDRIIRRFLNNTQMAMGVRRRPYTGRR
jgi:hypothetical protein